MYGNQYVISSPKNEELMQLFYDMCERYKIVHNNEQIFEYLHKFEDKAENAQLSLWDL